MGVMWSLIIVAIGLNPKDRIQVSNPRCLRWVASSPYQPHDRGLDVAQIVLIPAQDVYD